VTSLSQHFPPGIEERAHLDSNLLSRLFAKLNFLPICGLILFVALAAARAETPEDVQARMLDEIVANLQRIDSSLQQHDLTDHDLQDLRGQISPLGAETAAVISRLTPRLAAVDARLEQLGPTPDAKAPPEDPHVTADRAEQQKTHDTIDALLKRGKLLAVQIDQNTAQISARRRTLFTRSLFEHSPGLVSPGLWYRLSLEAPRDVQSLRDLVVNWAETFGGKLAGWRLPAFIGLLGLVALLCWPLSALARWVRLREHAVTEPKPLGKMLGAFRITFAIASLPLAVLFAIGGIFQAFELHDPHVQAITRSLVEAVALVALTAGLGNGLLSPERPNWRLLGVSDDAAEYVLKLALSIAVVVAITRIDEAIIDTIGGSAALQTTIRGIGAVIIGVGIGVALWRSGAKQNGNEDVFGPRVATVPDWSGPLRILLWGVAGVIVIAVFAGFPIFAGFLVNQIVWVTGVVTITTILRGVVDAGVSASCKPNTAFGRNVVAIVGISQKSLEQLAILIGGAVRVVAFVAGLLLILAPWGLQSADIPGYFHTAFFGFKVDNLTISLSSVGFALAIFAAGYAITRAVGRWLDVSYLPHTSLDIGLRNAIKTSLGYVGISVSALFSLAYIGVSFEKLAIVASALSIGIGFGLQSIVNNFVSGLILLWERAIRAGDWIIVGNDEGFVRRINVRSTEIETFDRAAVIIPNSNLVTGVVKNFVRTDRVGRIKIAASIDLSADPAQARDAIAAIVDSHELVLENPTPIIVLNSFDTAHIHFEIYCFVADIATTIAVRSELNFAIFQKLKLEGWLGGPTPSSIVTLAGLEKFEPLLKEALSSAQRELPR
jgi:potassium-dependent mechanosensitive channel